MIQSTDVTVVVPAHDEEDLLPALLGDLMTQTRPPKEVVVVDSMSTDGTVDVTKAFPASLCPIRLIPGPLGAGAARNAGARVVTSPWVLFLDADVRVPPDFVASLLCRVEPGPSMVHTVGFTVGEPRFRRAAELLCRYFRMFATTPSPALVGHCVLVEVALHEALGGFDTDLVLGEDHDYARRARRVGASMHWIAEIAIEVSARRFQNDQRLRALFRYTVSELRRLWCTLVVNRVPLGVPRSSGQR